MAIAMGKRGGQRRYLRVVLVGNSNRIRVRALGNGVKDKEGVGFRYTGI